MKPWRTLTGWTIIAGFNDRLRPRLAAARARQAEREARAWAAVGKAAKAVLPELPGVVGLGLVTAGVFRNWGPGWALIAAGAPLVVAYVLRETAFVWRRRAR